MTQIILLGAVIALFAFIYFLRRFSTAWAMRDWRHTQGRVVMAEMRRGKKKSSDGCLLYDPVLRYSYTVGEHTFEGSRFMHQAGRNSASRTTQFIARLTQGAEVPVYYHPRNPAEAVVQPLSWQGSAVAVLTSALLLIILAAVLWCA
ncbi:DUF3592 domain-containing protein [Prosthecobacter sp.]|uniref:DUF3592 domain-containing protein n=1 Tax=Prosthecobacter sp. TaxID=1965333 RepID=UPI002487B634|nr:DUF3592 domain-containing protein [Prosthecobacter sp.]MDI1313105.1 DUF3592 domain-containing protein [Prosthecobacter sp.]